MRRTTPPQLANEAETPFGRIRPVFEDFDLATPGWSLEDTTIEQTFEQRTVERAEMIMTSERADVREERPASPRRSPRRATSAGDESYVEMPSPRRSTRRRTTVARLGFPSMGDSTRESLAASIARSPEPESPSKPSRASQAEFGSAELEAQEPELPEPDVKSTPAVVARALRSQERMPRMSTPSSKPSSNDFFERRLLDSARRRTLAQLPGQEEWDGLDSSTPAQPPRRISRKREDKSPSIFRPSPLSDLVDPANVPPTPRASSTRPAEHLMQRLEPEAQQHTPKNKFVLPPSVSTRKKRQSPGKALFQRASIESVDSPQPAPKPAPKAIANVAQPKFLDELSEKLSSRASTPEPTPALVPAQPQPQMAQSLRKSASLERSSRSSSQSDLSRSSRKRTVINIGAGGKIRVNSPSAAELVEEEERSLRLESDSSASLSRGDILVDMPLDRSESRERHIADWSRHAFEETRRRSGSVLSSSSKLTRQGQSEESRSATPSSLSASDNSGWTPPPPRPENPTPRTASPAKDAQYDTSASLPSRPSAPAFSESSSMSAPKRPSNPTPTHAHPAREPSPETHALSKSANDAPVFAKTAPQLLAHSSDRPVKRVPVRKSAPAAVKSAKLPIAKPVARPAQPAPKPTAAAPKQTQAKPPLNKAMKRRAASDPKPEEPTVFPARVRNGPPVLAKPQAKSRLPVSSQSPERGAKRAKRAASSPPPPQPEPEQAAGETSTTPPHIREALATPRVTVRRTPRRTPRTPAPDWPELGLSAGQGQFTFEHKLRAAAEEPEADGPSISYPSRASDPSADARDTCAPANAREPRSLYGTFYTASEPYDTAEEAEDSGDGEVLSPEEEFEGIRPHGMELSAVLEVTEGEVSRLSHTSHISRGTPRPVTPEAPVPEREEEEEATPKAAPPAPAPIEEEHEDSFSRRIGGGVLSFLSGLVGTPAAPVAAPEPAPEPVQEVPMKQVSTKPVTRPASERAAPKRLRSATVSGKENAPAAKATKTQPEAAQKEAKEGKKTSHALKTAATRTRAPLAPRQPGAPKEPKEVKAKETKAKRKHDAPSPPRNVRRKVPALRPASALSRPAAKPSLRTSSKPAVRADARPIRSLPKTAHAPAPFAPPAGRVASSSASVTAFTAAALARLPKPGATAAKASPVKIRDMERARDLAVRKAVFERWASEPHAQEPSFSFAAPPPGEAQADSSNPVAPLGESSAPNAATHKAEGKAGASLRSAKAKKLTVPVSGKTPGKASRQRAESRAKFDAKVARRQALKAREEAERERIRRQVEEEMDAERRRRTVVRARPLPEMYRH